MKLWSDSFQEGATIPEEFAFARPHRQQRVELAGNRNPHLAWCDAPAGTRSFVLICHDPDAPSRRDDVNREDRTVPAGLPRVDFYHWILFDIPIASSSIAAGEHSDGVVPGGKPGPVCAKGMRHGINSFTEWFAEDPSMAGTYYGYDGPAPPWNDAIVHRYHFTLYAVALDRCPVGDAPRGPDVLAAIEGRVLDRARLTGRYSINAEAV